MREADEVIVQGGPAPLPSMEAMLQDFTRSNPNLAWMTQMLAAQRQAEAQPDARDAHIASLEQELAQCSARETRLQRVVRRLAGDLQAAHELLADLAAASGACGLCWGEDAQCPGCRGRGRPGRFAPDPELRARFFTESPEASAASRSSTHLDHSQRS
jgi:hypothetical protein